MLAKYYVVVANSAWVLVCVNIWCRRRVNGGPRGGPSRCVSDLLPLDAEPHGDLARPAVQRHPRNWTTPVRFTTIHGIYDVVFGSWVVGFRHDQHFQRAANAAVKCGCAAFTITINLFLNYPRAASSHHPTPWPRLRTTPQLPPWPYSSVLGSHGGGTHHPRLCTASQWRLPVTAGHRLSLSPRTPPPFSPPLPHDAMRKSPLLAAEEALWCLVCSSARFFCPVLLRGSTCGASLPRTAPRRQVSPPRASPPPPARDARDVRQTAKKGAWGATAQHPAGSPFFCLVLLLPPPTLARETPLEKARGGDAGTVLFLWLPPEESPGPFLLSVSPSVSSAWL